MNDLPDDTKVGDLTVAEFGALIQAVFKRAMLQATEHAGTPQQAKTLKQATRYGSTTYADKVGTTYKG